MCIDCIMSNMRRKQVNAILSDYDGTLCPTTSVSEDGSDSVGMIPNELKQTLVRISKRIPVCIVCIISSKDFTFLSRKSKIC